MQGYRNLCFLLTKSYQEGQKQGIAYIDRDWLCVERCEGLLAIEPGIDGFSARTNIDQVEQVEAWMHLFPDSYYFGLHRLGRESERDWQRQLRALSRQKALPIVALNAACFAEEADYDAHEVRVAIQESQVVSARADSPYSRKQYWRSNTQMQACFADIPEAIENTYMISKRLNVRLDLGKVCLPDFPVDKGKSLIAHLAEMSQDITESFNASSDASGVYLNQRQIFEQLANASGSVRFNIKGGTDGLVRAAHTAARLGTTMNEIAAASKTHLDFESSIQKEIEATNS